MKQVTRHCDRCGACILEGGSVLQVKTGELVGNLPGELDFWVVS